MSVTDIRARAFPAQGVAIQNEPARKDHGQLIAWIKDPLPPMPKLYPVPLTDDDIEATARYVETFTAK